MVNGSDNTPPSWQGVGGKVRFKKCEYHSIKWDSKVHSECPLCKNDPPKCTCRWINPQIHLRIEDYISIGQELSKIVCLRCGLEIATVPHTRVLDEKVIDEVEL
jgi:hypothetical protein